MKLLFKKLCVLLVGFLAPLLILEVVMRAAGSGHGPTLDPNYDRSRVRYFVSGARFNPWSQGSSNALRIAVIGDSISNGAGVEQDDSYPFRLERLLNLNEGQPPVQMSVHAKGGTSTHMQLGFLADAFLIHPKVVILGICLNDTEDWTQPEEIKRWRDKQMPRVPAPWLAAVLKHSRAMNWVYVKAENQRCRRACSRNYEHLYDPRYSGWNRFVSALHEFQTQCRAHDAQFVAVIFPAMGELNNYTLDYAHERIRHALEKEHAHYLDLLPDFRGKNPIRLQAVPNVDGHPNEIAHRIAAESILEFLLANQLIDPGYLPVHRTEAGSAFWKRVSHRMQNPAGERDRKDNIDPSFMVNP